MGKNGVFFASAVIHTVHRFIHRGSKTGKRRRRFLSVDIMKTDTLRQIFHFFANCGFDKKVFNGRKIGLDKLSKGNVIILALKKA